MSTFLFSISDAEILRISLICVLVFAALQTWREKITKRANLILNSAPTLPLLLSFQFALLFFLPAYRHVVVTLLFLFLTGISWYEIIIPSFLRTKFAYFILAPIIGLVLISVIGAYFIAFDINIRFLAPTLLLVSLISFLLQFSYNKEKLSLLFKELRFVSRSTIIVFSSLITPVILLLILPVLLSDYSTSAYRIGPDLATYAKMSQFYLDGGTWTEAGKRSIEFIGMSPVEVGRYCTDTMSWPPLFYYRWGLTAYQATVTVITFTDHSFETAFISMAIPYLLVCGFILMWLIIQFRLSISIAVLGALALTFNSNLLMMWYEGFYGNSFAMIFFPLVLYIFIYHRSTENISKNDLIKLILFSSILMAAGLSSYPEAVLFILSGFIAIVFMVDLLYNKTIKWSSYMIMFCSAIIGLLIVLPCDFLEEWAVFAYSQLFVEGGNGYPQPLWALPSEILGLQSIYLHQTIRLAGESLTRAVQDLVFACMSSGLILFSTLAYFRKNRSTGNILYIASIAMVIISACLVAYKSPHNYTFMKMYVFHLPFLMLIFWGSLTAFSENSFLKLDFFPRWLLLLVVIPTILSGLIYILQYKAESTLISEKRIALHKELKGVDFKNTVIYASLIGTSISDYLYAPVLSVPWLVPAHWKGKPYFYNFLHHKVYFLVEKRPKFEYYNSQTKIIFENEWCYIIDSGKTIKDALQSTSLTPMISIWTNPFTHKRYNSINFELFDGLITFFREVNPKIKAHNLAIGLPPDFDPELYLQMNPILIKFWNSKGIFESGRPLLDHAEIHYREFGAKEGWQYN